ncbi:hypothetical protein HDU86_005585 [Geranomyces michiganensis]|nr:hypothetical protein HDU86_005585 [Geranomyces michiganensis]
MVCLTKTHALLALLASVLLASPVAAHAEYANTAAVADGEAGAGAVKCPIAHKCPYYDHAKHAPADGAAAADQHKGCPLKTGGCPYYDAHKADHTVEDVVVAESGECPLAKKCKWYQDVKDGKTKDVDFEKTDCPLAGKCPYYEEIKKNGSAGASDCPVLHACPHFSRKDIETAPHVKGQPHGHPHDHAKCPHLQAQKAATAAGSYAGRDEL